MTPKPTTSPPAAAAAPGPGPYIHRHHNDVNGANIHRATASMKTPTITSRRGMLASCICVAMQVCSADKAAWGARRTHAPAAYETRPVAVPPHTFHIFHAAIDMRYYYYFRHYFSADTLTLLLSPDAAARRLRGPVTVIDAISPILRL